MKIEIRTPQTREDFKAYYGLRFKVLREPWGQPRGSEKDDYEPISRHFMAVDADSDRLVGVVKVFERSEGVAWISHLAVLPEVQKLGVGKVLMDAAEDYARQAGFKKIGCQSRLTTTTYFQKLGYEITGLPTHYFGTTQVVWMEKDL